MQWLYFGRKFPGETETLINSTEYKCFNRWFFVSCNPLYRRCVYIYIYIHTQYILYIHHHVYIDYICIYMRANIFIGIAKNVCVHRFIYVHILMRQYFVFKYHTFSCVSQQCALKFNIDDPNRAPSFPKLFIPHCPFA